MSDSITPMPGVVAGGKPSVRQTPKPGTTADAPPGSQTAAPRRKFTKRERNLTFAGLLVVFLLGALDQTIVSTAMPRIIEHLGGLNLYTWVTTAYLLASTVMVPIYGKLSDDYGRKPILIIGVVIFLVGSALSGLAGEFGDLPLLGGGMTQLIAFRALQGLGGAALFSSAFAIIADMIPAAERGKYQGLFGGVFGLAAVLGPLVGGFFTDLGDTHLLGMTVAGWRWVFYVNVPIGLLALFMIARVMPALPAAGKKGNLDLLGAVLIVTTFVPMLLALTWAGTTYPWGSPVILAMLGFTVLSLAAFVYVEARVSDPMLPLELFRIRVFTTANLASFVINVAFLGIVMFLPLFMQLVLGVSATNSGFTLLPLMSGMIVSSFVAGLVVTRTGKYKPLMITGSVILLVGVFLLTRIDLDTTLFSLGWRMVLVGIGLGPAQSQFTLAIQNAVPFSRMGVATSASQFFRQIGSVIGLAVFGTLLTLSVQREIPKYVPALPGVTQAFDLSSLSGLSSEAGAAGPDAGAAGDAGGVLGAIQGAAAALSEKLAAVVAGDAAAAAAVAADETLPASLREFATRAPGLTPDERAAQAPLVAAGVEQYFGDLAAGLDHGIKQGFSESIKLLFIVSFAILLLGSAIIPFIPGLPLRKVAAIDATRMAE
ncbi:MAG: MFS transporter [Trueperaceae bacterium]|nr:MFS transporter [Trueperaceae bacterium]MCO5173492.1 MFS transporter [Trueperaceae bacterium]